MLLFKSTLYVLQQLSLISYYQCYKKVYLTVIIQCDVPLLLGGREPHQIVQVQKARVVAQLCQFQSLDGAEGVRCMCLLAIAYIATKDFVGKLPAIHIRPLRRNSLFPVTRT